MIVRSFDRPDEAWPLPGGARMDVLREFGGMTLGRGTAPPGWHSERCEMPHLGIILSGREVVRMADGTEIELRPGDAFVIPPGHDARVVGDEPCISLDVLLDD